MKNPHFDAVALVALAACRKERSILPAPLELQ